MSHPREFVYYGRLEPVLLNGVKNGLYPSRVAYSEVAGNLQLGGTTLAGREGTARVSGELKLAGAPAFELITAR